MRSFSLTFLASLAFIVPTFVVAACSSSTSAPSGPAGDGGTSSGSSGGSGSSSGSGSGGGSGSGSGGGSGSGSSSGASEDGGRAVATCAQASAVAQTEGATLIAGSWGTIPTALQQLPAGATLCGTASTGDSSADFGYTYLLSDLSGTAISTFYSPLVAQVSGCGTLSSVDGSYSFTCSNGGQGFIIPAPALQILELGYTP